MDGSLGVWHSACFQPDLNRVALGSGRGQVKVDEVLGFLCHSTTQASSQDSEPSGVVLYILANSFLIRKEGMEGGREVLLYQIFLAFQSLNGLIKVEWD